MLLKPPLLALVAPFTGAWIEISASTSASNAKTSHPSRVRGLKFYIDDDMGTVRHVAPFTGAWIEIRNGSSPAAICQRRTLHGCVD